MASTSIMFMPPLTKASLLGEVAKRRMNSRVNQVMQTASTMASLGLSTWRLLRSLLEMAGMVLSVRATVDSTMKLIEMTATT